MKTVFVAPHNDDETLFGAYIIQRLQCDLVVCIGDPAHHAERMDETMSAWQWIGGGNTIWQWPVFPVGYVVDWREVGAVYMAELAARYQRAVIPMANFDANDHSPSRPGETHGVQQHDMIGHIAEQAFGADRIAGRYTTYTKQGRDTDGVEEIPDAEMIRCKLAAMACYASQISNPATRPWFTDGSCLREYVVGGSDV